MPSLGWRIRAGALIAVGAFGVHDLRYLIAYRGHASHELAVQGHGYLHMLAPVLAGTLVLAAAAFAARLAGAFARGERDGSPPPKTGRIWALASALLVAVYSLQESLEGELAAGHPSGLAALFGHGGWLAAPLAVAIGLLIALALRGAASAIASAAGRRRSSLVLWAPPGASSPVARSVWAPPAGGALARRLAPRAPPAAA